MKGTSVGRIVAAQAFTPRCWVMLLLIVAVVGPGCKQAGQDTGPAQSTPVRASQEQIDTATDKARAAADELGRRLKQKLMLELEAGGPVAAIHVCSTVAQEVAAECSREGMTVRRVTLKVRNPADTPTAFERAKLHQFHAQHRENALPREVTVVRRTDRGEPILHYMRPIKIGGVCLNCHGAPAQLDPAVKVALRETYPDDEAVGYEAGDLRGAFSVTVPLDHVD